MLISKGYFTLLRCQFIWPENFGRYKAPKNATDSPAINLSIRAMADRGSKIGVVLKKASAEK
jgi:hypothetical protein